MTLPTPDQQGGSERRRLVTDDDCHWYIIPAERRVEFDAWLESDAAMDGEELEWAVRLSMHPANYTFAGWQEDK